MAKVKRLKITHQPKCTGCELCVMETQRQLKKVGLNDSLIRILKKKGSTFQVELDPQIQNLNIQAISDICPTKVLKTTEEEEFEDEEF